MVESNNSIQHLLRNGIDMIEERDFNNPFLDVQLILMELLNKDKLYLIMHPEEQVSQNIADRYYAMVKKRNEGYPLQYMINKQEFMGLEFYVEDGVLIPRPDTEILVEKVINTVKTHKELQYNELDILDIGTGSGAIALSLAYYLKNSNVTAIDISETALKVAEINRKKFDLANARILRGDLFKDFYIDALSENKNNSIANSKYTNASNKYPDANSKYTNASDKYPDVNSKNTDVNSENNNANDKYNDSNNKYTEAFNKRYDIIVSNPPYIEKQEIDGLQTEVSVYEPRLALDGGESGLMFYERIAQLLGSYLKPGGRVYLEIGNRQASEVSALMLNTGLFKSVTVIKDLSQNDRVIAAE